MSSLLDQVKVLEQCRISPPSNSVPTTILPITFLDVPWLNCCPVQYAFFYKASFSAAQFTEEVLPQLKKSLSLCLQLFFPLCGNSVIPPQPLEPYILYKDDDSIPLLVAQSSVPFSDFLKDGPKDANEVHSLMPPTPPTSGTPVGEVTPFLVLQVTLFPNSGLSIAMSYRHIIADGTSSSHFMKTWALIFKANCDMSIVPISLPILYKGVIKDPNGIKDIALNQWRAMGSPTWNDSNTSSLMEDNVRATFTLSRVEIDQLKKWVLTKCGNGTEIAPNMHFSSFVVTMAFIWVCLIKSLDVITSKDLCIDDEDELCHFFILADCRNKYGLDIPVTYFGNCLTGRFVSVARHKFSQEDSVAIVAEAISHIVQSYSNGALDGYTDLFSKFGNIAKKGEKCFGTAGSPKQARYETDFGWGRPEKVEVVHTDISGSISLIDSRNKDGGIEVGICRDKRQMEVFMSFFQQGMKQFL